jgi:beta-fructofuranosidase
MFYTGVVEAGGIRHASICRATSTDGLLTWTKDPLNPVIAGPPDGIPADAFRDPFVWRDGDAWSMVVGGGTADGLGTVLLYRSPDLRTWTYAGTLLSADDLDRAVDADSPCWECPQLVRTPGADLLVASLVDRSPGIRPSHVMAFVGRLADDRFVVERTAQLGMGPDFYAPSVVRAPDGRTILFGWIPEDPPPPGSQRTWAGSLTLPRVVRIDEDGAVGLGFADEVAALRSTAQEAVARDIPADAPAWRQPLPGRHAELAAAIDPGRAAEVTIELRDGDDAGPAARIRYFPADRRLTVARRGIVSVAGRSARSVAILPDSGSSLVRLRLVLDGSVLELEADGHVMATLRLPALRDDEPVITFAATGGPARVDALAAWTLGTPRGPA